MRRVPMVVALLPYAAGIVLAEETKTLAPNVWLWLLVATAALLAVCLLMPWRRAEQCHVKVGSGSAWVATVALFFIAFGGLRTRLADPALHPDHYQHLYHSGDTLELALFETPRRTPKAYVATATVAAVWHDSLRYTSRGKVRLTMAVDNVATTLRCGDRLVAKVEPRPFEPQTTPDGFNRAKYWRRKGVTGRCYLSEGAYLRTEASTLSLRARAERWREVFCYRLHQSRLTPQQVAVAEALLLGWRGDIDSETNALYRDAGVAHLLCVSGLHVGLVAAALTALLWPIGRRRWQRALRGAIVVCGVWMFALLSGLAPSTVRAATMFTIFIVVDVFALHTSRYNTVALSAMAMLLWSPMLLFDVGFELSYAAVLGILAGSGAASALRPRGSTAVARWVAGVYDLFVVTTSAQVATLPLVLYYFHQFPTYFLVANMTVLPCAGVLMVAALAVLVVGSWPVVGVVAEWVLRALLTAVEWLLRHVSAWPHATIEAGGFTTASAVCLAAAVVAFFVGFNAISAGCRADRV